MPSIRRFVPVVVLALVFVGLLAVAVDTALESGGEDPSAADVPPPLRVATNFVATLLFGSLALAAVPGYTERVVDEATDGFLRALLWGVGVSVAVLVAIVVLALTGIGIVVAVPLAFGFAVVGGVGNALGYLALLDGRVADRRVALAVGAAVAGVASAAPLLGQAVGFVVGGIGVGGMARDYADPNGRGRAARRQ